MRGLTRLIGTTRSALANSLVGPRLPEPKRKITVFSRLTIDKKAAEKHNQIMNAGFGNPGSSDVRGPFPGVDSIESRIEITPQSDITHSTREQQHTLKFLLNAGSKIVIRDQDGIYENGSNKPPVTEQSLAGPAVAMIAVKPWSAYSLRSDSPVTAVVAQGTYSDLPPIGVDEQEKVPQEDLMRMSSNHPVWIGLDCTGDERVGKITSGYVKLVRERLAQATEKGEETGKYNSEVQEFGETVRTIRQLRASEQNDATHYIMLFGLTYQSAQDYQNFPHDNFMHIHPRSRLERHLTDGGTYQVIMATDPIQNADNKPMSCIKIFDPIFAKDIYVHLVPPNSCHSLYLPARTNHKFKVCLAPEVYEFCKEAYPILMKEGMIPQDAVEPTHAVVEFFRTNGQDDDRLADVFDKHGGRKSMLETLKKTEGVVVETTHEFETQEISGEKTQEGVRSSYESSIAKQTVGIEDPRTMSEAAMQIIIQEYRRIATTPDFAKGGVISLPSEVEKNFQRQLIEDHGKFTKLEQEMFCRPRVSMKESTPPSRSR